MGVIANKGLGIVGKAVNCLKGAWSPSSVAKGHLTNSLANAFTGVEIGNRGMAGMGGYFKESLKDIGRATKEYATQGGAKGIATRVGSAAGLAYAPRLLSGSANPFVNSNGEMDIVGIPFI